MARYTQSYAGERRTRSVGIKLTPNERQQLENAAKKSGAQLSEFVRDLCLKRAQKRGTAPVGARKNPDVRALVNALIDIGNNLNQLTRLANTDKEIIYFDELHETTDQLKAALARVMGL